MQKETRKLLGSRGSAFTRRIRGTDECAYRKKLSEKEPSEGKKKEGDESVEGGQEGGGGSFYLKKSNLDNRPHPEGRDVLKKGGGGNKKIKVKVDTFAI